jgi:hypothetical protein
MQRNSSSSLLKPLAILIASAILVACADKPGSEGWCQAMDEKSKGDWTGADAKTYAAHCIFDSTTIGSEAWCDDLKEKPKGEWTTQEVADFAQYCVVEAVQQEAVQQ